MDGPKGNLFLPLPSPASSPREDQTLPENPRPPPTKLQAHQILEGSGSRLCENLDPRRVMDSAAASPRVPQSVRSGASSSIKVGPQTDSRSTKRTEGPTLAQRLLSPASASPLFPLATPDHVQLNDQVYRFLALALRAFVLTWWSKLSPKDKEFLPQITKVVQHVVKNVQERLDEEKLTEMLLVDIPVLVQRHYTDYRSAAAKVGTSYGASTDLPRTFHRLQPHIAVQVEDTQGASLGAEGLLDPIYLGAAVDMILKACLPPEESGADMERHILREIIVGPILSSSLPRVVQPWFIHKALLEVLGPPKQAEEVSYSKYPGMY